MRLLLTMLLIAVFCTCVRAQIGASVDAEYASWCMVDSLPGGQVVRFTRLVNIATLKVVDVDPIAGTAYTVAGTLMTCEAYDLRETLRDPLTDLYEACQCEYTISQEGHRVTVIRGAATQNYDVEFQEVVRRKCAGQMSSVVVHRDTLTKTEEIPTVARLQYFWNFTAPGQYIDHVDFRVYTGASTPTIVRVDFNPATVEASYPGLSLDPADFSYDGSNYLAMNAAFQLVLDEALPATVNAVTTLTSVDVNLSIFTQVLHQPEYPYVTLPWKDDTDRDVLSTIPLNKLGYGSPGLGTNTVTSTYAEQCEGIYTEHYGSYIDWNPDFPLALQPYLSPVTTFQPGQSNPTAFCDVSPAVCAELAVDPVEVTNCIETCSDVLNLAGHVGLADVDTTLTGATYNSISIYVTTGPVGVVLDGQRINYPAGWSTLWSAAPGKLLQNSIRIDATGAEAIISFVR